MPKKTYDSIESLMADENNRSGDIVKTAADQNQRQAFLDFTKAMKMSNVNVVGVMIAGEPGFGCLWAPEIVHSRTERATKELVELAVRAVESTAKELTTATDF